MSVLQFWLMVVLVALAFGVIFFGVKFARRGEIFEDCLSLSRMRAARGIFALLIIFHHLSIEINDSGVGEGFSNIGYLAVAVFFFCSGFGLFKSYREKPQYMKGFLLRRLPEVLFPFWIINILYIVVFSLGNVKMSGLDLLRYFFGVGLINEYAWFVPVLVLFYIGFYLLFRFLKEGPAFWGMGIFTLLFIALCMAFHVDNWWYNSSIALFLGMAGARYEARLMAFLRRGTWWKMGVFFVLFFAGFFAAPRVLEAIKPAGLADLKTGVQIVTVALFLVFFLLLQSKVRLQNAALMHLGAAAFEIYLIQRLVIVSLKPLAPFSLRPMTWVQTEPAFYAACVLVGTIVLGLLLHALMSRFVLRPYRTLFQRERRKSNGKIHEA